MIFRGLAVQRREFEAVSPITSANPPNHQVQPGTYWWHTLHTIPVHKRVTQDGTITTELYMKPTHSGILVHHSSAHPRSTEDAVAFYQSFEGLQHDSRKHPRYGDYTDAGEWPPHVYSLEVEGSNSEKQNTTPTKENLQGWTTAQQLNLTQDLT